MDQPPLIATVPVRSTNGAVSSQPGATPRVSHRKYQKGWKPVPSHAMRHSPPHHDRCRTVEPRRWRSL